MINLVEVVVEIRITVHLLVKVLDVTIVVVEVIKLINECQKPKSSYQETHHTKEESFLFFHETRLVDEKSRDKMDPRNEICIFVGYYDSGY